MNHDALETRLQVQGQVQLSKQGQVRWQTGHPWFFERDLQKAPRFGGIYEVQDATAHTLGFALASPQSKILIRMLHCHNNQIVDRTRRVLGIIGKRRHGSAHIHIE